MSEYLSPGYQVDTLNGGKVKIIKMLGEGGQGVVYLVDYNGATKALKWYKPNGMGQDPKAFYENIKSNVAKKAPSKEFLWPEDVTGWVNGVFGYIMDVRPEGYYEISKYMLRKQTFKSYRVAIDAALQIVSAFRILHNNGYSYQDLNDGNFFINPNNGKVLICDNDNVAPDRYVSGVLGKQRYMAPEIVVGKEKPNKQTDFHSMAVLLFIIFCMSHPLEGKRWREAELTDSAQKKLYGSEALFIFDPDDDANKAEKIINKNAITVWGVLPEYVKALFLKAFSQKALLENPNARPIELEWVKALVRFRSEIVACDCGNEIFTEQGRPCACDFCGQKADVPFRLEFRNYSIPGIADSRIYQCQLGTCRADEALTPFGRVIAKPDNPKMLGIRNLSKNAWKAVTPSGKEKKVLPNEVIPLIDGITFEIGNETIKITANK